jgi:formylglycine-generating enzyme required for sulfatase activity
MTIARNVEGQDANWETGTPGSGAMFKGHSDNSPSSALAAAADNDPYNGTENTSSQAMGSGKEQKRTFTLSNGEVIWDFAGNVWEWVDWETGGEFTPVLQGNKAFDGTDGAAVAAWREFTLLDRKIDNGDVMNPLTWQSSNPVLNSSHGIGQYYAGTSGGAALRGGNWNNGSNAGAFTLNLNNSTTNTNTNIGFRCLGGRWQTWETV